MHPSTFRPCYPYRLARCAMAIACVLLIVATPGEALAQSSPAPSDTAAEEAPKIPADQLDSLVAPIALYPDEILAQVLVASTYPLEIIQLQQWLARNPDLKDKALTDALMKQPWDPSIQALAAMPDVVKRLADDIQWTTDLGNAFLAQQGDVMDAVQRMRKKAKDNGALKSNEQMKVETQVVEQKTVIVVQSASPEVIYVPTYSPVVVYGPPVYPYPPIYYPPPPPAGYWATAAISFGVGVAVGAAWGHCGWGCGWGHNDIDININNNFNRNTNINNISGNRNVSGNRGGGNTWQHNPQHRGGAPYSNKATANKYGGSARGDSLSSRQSSARQQVGRQGGNMPSASNRASGSGAGGRGGSPGVSNRAGGGSSGSFGSAGASNRSGGSRDSIGSREASRGSSSRGSSAFGSGGYSGSSARASSSRGASSMSSRGGGGRSGGGGGRGRR